MNAVDEARAHAHIFPMKYALPVLGLVAFVIGLVFVTFNGFDASLITLNGWIALGLGVVLSLALGIGLMLLVFHSARHGYDDRIERDTPETDH